MTSQGAIKPPCLLASMLLAGTCLALSSCMSSTFLLKENPYVNDRSALERGLILYDYHCAGCHGAGAEGDGPDNPQLEPPPPSLRDFVSKHSDGAIASTIMGGSFAGMPAHNSQLTQDEMWQVVTFLQSLNKDSD